MRSQRVTVAARELEFLPSLFGFLVLKKLFSEFYSIFSKYSDIWTDHKLLYFSWKLRFDLWICNFECFIVIFCKSLAPHTLFRAHLAVVLKSPEPNSNPERNIRAPFAVTYTARNYRFYLARLRERQPDDAKSAKKNNKQAHRTSKGLSFAAWCLLTHRNWFSNTARH